MLDWLLDVAAVAGRWVHPEYGPPPANWSRLISFPTAESAMAWLRDESENWFAALQAVAAAGDHTRVIDVAEAMHWFSDQWTYWGHWHQVYTLSSAAAHALGDAGLEALHLNYLAWAFSTCLSQYPDAIDAATQALTIATEADDILQQAWAHYHIAWSCIRLGATGSPPKWRGGAACLNYDPDLFFPEGTAGPALRQADQAKRVCQSCPVRTPCLGFALRHGVAFGIWGGTTAEERRQGAAWLGARHQVTH